MDLCMGHPRVWGGADSGKRKRQTAGEQFKWRRSAIRGEVIMSSATPDYFAAFENIAMTRTGSGVLTVRFRTDGGPATFSGRLCLPR